MSAQKDLRRNAIERRVDRMAALWNDLAGNDVARLYRWRTEQDSLQLVDAFVETQWSDAAEIPDLLIRLETPFDRSDRYGFDLIETLRTEYDEDREGLEIADMAADWSFEPSAEDTSDIAVFARACGSLLEHYPAITGNVIAYLSPAAISDVTAWTSWLARYLRSDPPPYLRVMVVDVDSAPVFDDLCAAEPKRAVSIDLDLDMPGAIAELAGDGDPREPGVAFRKHLTALTHAAAQGDVAAARAAGDAAEAIARAEGWKQMQVATRMAIGGALLGSGDFGGSLESYRAAATLADTMVDEGDPAGPQLSVQCGLAEGAALLSAARYGEAAQVYERTAPFAAAAGDGLSALECWRMAAYCHEVGEDPEPAWQCGQRALEAGESLDEELRRNATLPYVGQCLLRLTRHASYAAEAERVRERMVALVGDDWEDKIEQGEPGS